MNQELLRNSFLQKAAQAADLVVAIGDYDPRTHPTPYIYSLETSRKHLYVYGSRHFSDPSSPHFSALCEAVESFAPQIVLTESIRQVRRTCPSAERDAFLARISRTTREDAVLLSESNLGVKLALDCHADIRGLEPSLGQQMAYLEELGFSKEDIVTYFICTTLSVSHLYSATMTPEELVDYRMRMLADESSWPLEYLSLERVERRTHELFGTFPIGDSTWFGLRTDPTISKERPEFGLLTEISIADTEYRDRCFVLEIARALDDADRVFVLYGASHAAMEEPALREILECDR